MYMYTEYCTRLYTQLKLYGKDACPGHNIVDLYVNVCGSTPCCRCMVNGNVAYDSLLSIMNMGGTTAIPRGLAP